MSRAPGRPPTARPPPIRSRSSCRSSAAPCSPATSPRPRSPPTLGPHHALRAQPGGAAEPPPAPPHPAVAAPLPPLRTSPRSGSQFGGHGPRIASQNEVGRQLGRRRPCGSAAPRPDRVDDLIRTVWEPDENRCETVLPVPVAPPSSKSQVTLASGYGPPGSRVLEVDVLVCRDGPPENEKFAVGRAGIFCVAEAESVTLRRVRRTVSGPSSSAS